MPASRPVTPAEESESVDPFHVRLAAAAAANPDRIALIEGERRVSWNEFHTRVRRAASRLNSAGVGRGDTVAMMARNCIELVEMYAATLHAGACAVPLSTMVSADALEAMLRDCRPSVVLAARQGYEALVDRPDALEGIAPENRLSLDFTASGWTPYETWLAAGADTLAPATVDEEDPFNLIYSSGTTGTPKGILHDHRMRARQLHRMARFGLDGEAVTIVSTPWYSNTTLVAALPTLAGGGTLVLMAKFDVAEFLETCQRERVTHAMLVPVQYQRILEHPDFDHYDLSAFRAKLSTSAPLRAEVIRDALDRWPGRLFEIYGLTEGGVTTVLDASAFPDKLHTVGRPAQGVDLRILDEQGHPCPRGEVGEIIGRATTMMVGYHNRPEQTEDMIWRDAHGQVFFKTGDLGRLDEDGFLEILDRKKDIIISGGFNIYASDLEAVLLQHPNVADAAVIGIPSERWGETPLGLVVLRGGDATPEEILEWANARLGRNQRLAGLEPRDSLPRSPIGKILKRRLREPYFRA